ncbi:MAG: preprotein translocase subunit SecA [Candidatus Dormibacteria bacterium]|jgi:preprotein translocase subunit SecA
MSLLSKVLGDPHKREISRHLRVVQEINDLEEAMRALSDDELRHKTDEFRERIGYQGADISFGQTYADDLDVLDEKASQADAEFASGAVSAESEAEIERQFARREKKERDQEQAEHLDEILPEAFAVVRETARRVLGMRHFDVQLVGGIVLHDGKIAEMKTGEGKTLVATLSLYLNALVGKGAHLVTVNDYLARRDAGWNAPVYHFLGLSVGVIAGQNLSFVYDPDYLDETHPDSRLQHLRPCTRREAYACDITYATNNELGFDYLRDNMAMTVEQCVQRRLHYAIVDEVDSILIDEARTPLIISGQASEPTEKYYTYARLIKNLVAEEDYTGDEKTKSVTLTDEGVAKIEKWTGISNIYDIEHAIEAHQVNQALRAWVHYQLDRDYIIRDGEVVIVDEFTGRTMPGRRWSDGLHQAIEAKEGVTVQQENITLATITFQNFFRLYHKLAGMTGTAITEAEEFDKIYKLEVVPIPTNQPMIRRDEPDLVYMTEAAKFKAVVEDIAERHGAGQPILVGTTSIEKSERLSRLLEKQGVTHNVLNAKQHEREAVIITEAGQPGAVTIATNMAGRGTDIVLGEGVAAQGGLYIIGTERHESRRIDNQLRGRAGRQGDPGETRFFLSFEDDLLRVFGGERIQGIMGRLHVDEDVALESKMFTRQIEGAQARVEGYHFDTRRHVVEYDDVMNRQREIIYGERRKILEGVDTRANFLNMLEHVVTEEVPTFCEGRHRDTWDLEGLWARMRQFAGPLLPSLGEVDLNSLGESVPEVIETLVGELTSLYEELEAKHGTELMRRAEQLVMLSVIDEKWRTYLTQMEHMREQIGFHGYGQMDPLVEYKQEAYHSFQDLMAEIQRDIVRFLYTIKFEALQPPQEPPPSEAAAEETAPPSPRADQPGSGRQGEAPPTPDSNGPGPAPSGGGGPAVPPARPAAAAASGSLARATVKSGGPPPARASVSALAPSPAPAPAPAPAAPAPVPVTSGSLSARAGAAARGMAIPGGAGMLPQTRVRNVVESSSGGTRRTDGAGLPGSNGRGAPCKMGRNERCWCGSGKKYKFCHGA